MVHCYVALNKDIIVVVVGGNGVAKVLGLVVVGVATAAGGGNDTVKLVEIDAADTATIVVDVDTAIDGTTAAMIVVMIAMVGVVGTIEVVVCNNLRRCGHHGCHHHRQQNPFFHNRRYPNSNRKNLPSRYI